MFFTAFCSFIVFYITILLFIHLYRLYLKVYSFISVFYHDVLSHNVRFVYVENILVEFLSLYYLSLIFFFECLIIFFKFWYFFIRLIFANHRIKFFFILFGITLLLSCYTSKAIIRYINNLSNAMVIGPTRLFWFKFFSHALRRASGGSIMDYSIKRFIHSIIDYSIKRFIHSIVDNPEYRG